nr:nucleotidyltransferase domain-containing protein [uncultured Roseibium sp.]
MARQSTRSSTLKYPLTSILGTKSSVVLLRELSEHGGFLTAPLLSQRCGISRASAWKELGVLEELGVVGSVGTERSRVYRLNPDYPLYSSLKDLFEQENCRFTKIRDAISNAVSSFENKVIATWIYGSVARGEDKPNSDLDIAIVFSTDNLEGQLESIRNILAFSAEELIFQPSVIGIGPTDVRRLTQSKDPWWQSVEKDALTVAGLHPVELSTQTTRQIV